MELRLLEYFLAVCEELHFTRAAEKVGISQPTLSHQIALLEARLGTRLFKRIGRKITLTESGELLLKHAKKVFYQLEQADLEINELKGLKRGKLTIGCSGSHLIHDSIVSFQKNYPYINLTVMDGPNQDTIERVLNNQFDIGIVYLPTENSNLIARKLFDTEFTVVVGEDHELAARHSISLVELESKPVFLLHKKFSIRQAVDQYCNNAGIHLNPVVELADTYSLITLTVINKGVTILPKDHVEKLLVDSIQNKRVKMIKISDNVPKREVGLIVRKDKHLSKAIKAFSEHLIQTNADS